MASTILGERLSYPTIEDSISYLLGYQNATGGLLAAELWAYPPWSTPITQLFLLKQYGAIPLR